MNRDFIHWRFLERPSINYSVVGWANGQQLAWFVFRIFDSNGYYLTPTVRIIDFGGDIDLVDAVIPKLVQYLRAEFNCHLLYFPVITPQWLPVLKAHGFITRFLEDARLRLDPSLKSDLLNYHITAAWSDVDYQVIAEE